MKVTYDLALYWVRSSIHWEEKFVPRSPALTTLLAIHPHDGMTCHVPAEFGKHVPSWTRVTRERVEEIERLLEEVGAFGTLKPLVEGNATGYYFVTWQITGSLKGRPFELQLNFVEPGEKWNALGQRFQDALARLLPSTG